jgi:hypothetical protein
MRLRERALNGTCTAAASLFARMPNASIMLYLSSFANLPYGVILWSSGLEYDMIRSEPRHSEVHCPIDHRLYHDGLCAQVQPRSFERYIVLIYM